MKNIPNNIDEHRRQSAPSVMNPLNNNNSTQMNTKNISTQENEDEFIHSLSASNQVSISWTDILDENAEMLIDQQLDHKQDQCLGTQDNITQPPPVSSIRPSSPQPAVNYKDVSPKVNTWRGESPKQQRHRRNLLPEPEPVPIISRNDQQNQVCSLDFLCSVEAEVKPIPPAPVVQPKVDTWWREGRPRSPSVNRSTRLTYVDQSSSTAAKLNSSYQNAQISPTRARKTWDYPSSTEMATNTTALDRDLGSPLIKQAYQLPVQANSINSQQAQQPQNQPNSNNSHQTQQFQNQPNSINSQQPQQLSTQKGNFNNSHQAQNQPKVSNPQAQQSPVQQAKTNSSQQQQQQIMDMQMKSSPHSERKIKANLPIIATTFNTQTDAQSVVNEDETSNNKRHSSTRLLDSAISASPAQNIKPQQQVLNELGTNAETVHTPISARGTLLTPTISTKTRTAKSSIISPATPSSSESTVYKRNLSFSLTKEHAIPSSLSRTSSVVSEQQQQQQYDKTFTLGPPAVLLVSSSSAKSRRTYYFEHENAFLVIILVFLLLSFEIFTRDHGLIYKSNCVKVAAHLSRTGELICNGSS